MVNIFSSPFQIIKANICQRWKQTNPTLGGVCIPREWSVERSSTMQSRVTCTCIEKWELTKSVHLFYFLLPQIAMVIPHPHSRYPHKVSHTLIQELFHNLSALLPFKIWYHFICAMPYFPARSTLSTPAVRSPFSLHSQWWNWGWLMASCFSSFLHKIMAEQSLISHRHHRSPQSAVF